MPRKPRQEFSVDEARRIALAAQGFAKPRPGGQVTAGHLRRVVRQLGLLQLDFVNVLVPAHLFVPYSRLGAYDPGTFDRAVYAGGQFTEQWAHEASIVPADCWPLLRHRREAYRQHPRSPLMRMRNRRRYLDEVLEIVQEQGAVTANDLPPVPGPARKPGDWHRSVPRWALEHHFGRGDLAVAKRLGNFQRVYDLPARIIPDEYRQRTPTQAEAQRALVARAATAYGIATAADIADYFRMTLRDTLPHLRSLAEEGVVREISVRGWKDSAFLHGDARLPRSVDAAALLSPFDPVVWFRPRAERLFDFHYRIEIYVPEKQRRWGYYVLPFLCGDRLCARVDLKADRAGRRLLVRAAHAEPGIDAGPVAARLARELYRVAAWLDLDGVTVARRGDLARALKDAVQSSRPGP